MIAPNRLKRRFKTDRPYQKLVADVSEFWYGNKSQDEPVYLEPILDLFNGEVLTFNISDYITVHNDQGFQHQHRYWKNVLKDHRAFQSMSHKATCLDNTAMESFFHNMKVEVMNEQFDTNAALIKAMAKWIDFYKHRRIKTKLAGKSPAKYQKLTAQKAP